MSAALTPTSDASWPSTTSASPTAALGPPTDDPYYQLYMGMQATIPFALRNMGVQVALSSVVFTLYLILLCVTQARHRQTWTFALATVVFALFFTTAFTNSIQLVHALQSPGHKVEMGIEFGDVVITLTLPWIGDWLIWLRMLSLWPIEERMKTVHLVMFGTPVVIKVFRFAVLCFLLNMLYDQMATSLNAADLGTKVWPLSWPTWAEYGAMLVDVSMCSAICIVRLTSLMTPTRSERRSLALQTRLRLLLTNTVSSFILPVIAAVVMIILGAVGSFDAYATMTKINAGITAINVLIAIIIPLIQSGHADERMKGSEPSHQANTFIQNKIRSRSRSQGQSAGRSHAGSHARHDANPSNGIMQTTLEESFVDQLDYGVQPYSPGFSTTGEKTMPGASGSLEDVHELDELSAAAVPAVSEPRSRMGSQDRMSRMRQGSLRRAGSESQLSSPNGGSGFNPTGSLSGAGYGVGLSDIPINEQEHGERRPDDVEAQRQDAPGPNYAVPNMQQLLAEHLHAQQQAGSPEAGSAGLAGLGEADQATQDVLRTMPRLSRFGQ